MSKLLDLDASGLKERIQWLQKELEIAETALVDTLPEEPKVAESVIRFRQYGGVYSYAAIRVNGEWYITQDGSRPSSRKAPYTWGDLLAWIGEQSWDTIEVLS